METLGRILNEITQSNQLQLGSYWDVVDARKKIEKSIRQSQVEYKEKEKKLSVLASKHKRDEDGVLITTLTIYNLSLTHKNVVRKSMDTLERLQELERMMLGVLNARNIDFIETDEVEETEVMISR